MVVWWRRRRNQVILTIALLAWLLFRKTKNDLTYEYTVACPSPKIVWEYLADFNNFKDVNPTILDFNILGDHGNFDHWTYTVDYTERLVYHPTITNYATAEIVVKSDGDEYVILSTHKTCFYTSWICLVSTSELRFRARPTTSGASVPETRCTEKITYECFFAFKSWCYAEAYGQRQLISHNVQKYFRAYYLGQVP